MQFFRRGWEPYNGGRGGRGAARGGGDTPATVISDDKLGGDNYCVGSSARGEGAGDRGHEGRAGQWAPLPRDKGPCSCNPAIEDQVPAGISADFTDYVSPPPPLLPTLPIFPRLRGAESSRSADRRSIVGQRKAPGKGEECEGRKHKPFKRMAF